MRCLSQDANCSLSSVSSTDIVQGSVSTAFGDPKRDVDPALEEIFMGLER